MPFEATELSIGFSIPLPIVSQILLKYCTHPHRIVRQYKQFRAHIHPSKQTARLFYLVRRRNIYCCSRARKAHSVFISGMPFSAFNRWKFYLLPTVRVDTSLSRYTPKVNAFRARPSPVCWSSKKDQCVICCQLTVARNELDKVPRDGIRKDKELRS